jgi:hypothetical protein
MSKYAKNSLRSIGPIVLAVIYAYLMASQFGPIGRAVHNVIMAGCMFFCGYVVVRNDNWFVNRAIRYGLYAWGFDSLNQAFWFAATHLFGITGTIVGMAAHGDVYEFGNYLAGPPAIIMTLTLSGQISRLARWVDKLVSE